jgi:fused signal recognition particle receptor
MSSTLLGIQTTTPRTGLRQPHREKERSAVATPVSERPVMERPVMERPVMERPVMERPVMERPVMERPVMERPVMERPVTGEERPRPPPPEWTNWEL